MSDQPAPAPTPQPAPAAGPVHTLRLPFPLQENEVITLLIRKHWFFLWPRTILWVLYAIVPVVVLTWLLGLIGVRDDLGAIWWGIVGLWLVWWALKLLLNYYRYHNDIWLITNQRLVDSFKANPFNLRLATADLVNIQDMSVHKVGVFASMFGFGDVVCETAGADRVPFLITGIPHPEEVQLLIDKERDRERGKFGNPTPGQV